LLHHESALCINPAYLFRPDAINPVQVGIIHS